MGTSSPANVPERRRYRRVSDAERDDIVDLYVNKAKSSVEIGNILDREPAVVRRVLHRAGISTPKLKWPAAEAMELLAGGMSDAQVSDRLGIEVKLLQQYVRRHTAQE